MSVLPEQHHWGLVIRVTDFRTRRGENVPGENRRQMMLWWECVDLSRQLVFGLLYKTHPT